MKEETGTTHHPGEPIPCTGLYRVFHYQHRLPHDVVIREGGVFPICNRCRDRVAFRLSTAASPLLTDPDFESREAA